jgi:hypothetical protein
LLSVYQQFKKPSKPVTSLSFYVQLFAGFGILALVWLGDDAGRIEYKIVLTVLAAVTLIRCLASYRKWKIGTQ